MHQAKDFCIQDTLLLMISFTPLGLLWYYSLSPWPSALARDFQPFGPIMVVVACSSLFPNSVWEHNCLETLFRESIVLRDHMISYFLIRETEFLGYACSQTEFGNKSGSV
ncbi:MAG: hypothetical protein DWB56_06220 [Candidatus Jettenia sp.]|nr:hypothetical protein [Candidatus Jettenia sp.]